MDWSQSYSAEWRVFKVNRKTWADGEMVRNVDSADVSRTADGSLLESGSFEVTGDFSNDYYRIVMIARQGGEIERVEVATLLFDVVGGDYNYGRTVHSVDGYSVLYPANTTAVKIGAFAMAGTDGAKYAGDLLASAINAPVSVDCSFILGENIVHELGETVLNAAWDVLEAGRCIIQIDGHGTVHIVKRPSASSLVLNSARKRLMSNGIKFESESSEIPNRYIVVDGNTITKVVNNDPDSPVSRSSRGYYVDIIDTSPTPVNSETMEEYAERKLREMSVIKETREYSREYAPDVYPYSIIRASIDGMQGSYRVNSQTIKCEYGITVNEKAYREISLW